MSAQRTILITGCSSGIGEHAARTLAARGWRVFATARKPADVARLSAEGLESLALDVSDAGSIEAALAEVLRRTGGRLDALFNNAAHALPGALEDMPTDALRAIFETNFFGWHHLTRAVIPVMRRQGHGRIVQNSSVLGLVAVRMRGPYIATKFALEGYSDVLRMELHGSGIEVVLIEPGPVRSRIRLNAQAHFEAWVDADSPAWGAFYTSTVKPRLYATNPGPDWGELGPEAVSAKLIHALEAARPRARYYVTRPTYIAGWMKRILPTRVLDRVLRQG